MSLVRYRISFHPCSHCGFENIEVEGREHGTWCWESQLNQPWLCGQCQIGERKIKAILDTFKKDVDLKVEPIKMIASDEIERIREDIRLALGIPPQLFKDSGCTPTAIEQFKDLLRKQIEDMINKNSPRFEVQVEAGKEAGVAEVTIKAIRGQNSEVDDNDRETT